MLSPMCHRFIVYLHLVYLPLSLISVLSLVYLGISAPWADIPLRVHHNYIISHLADRAPRCSLGVVIRGQAIDAVYSRANSEHFVPAENLRVPNLWLCPHTCSRPNSYNNLTRSIEQVAARGRNDAVESRSGSCIACTSCNR